jgi:Clp amino terminal domain, pathogenicity island component
VTGPADLLATLVDLVEERAAQGGDLDRLVAAVDVAAEIADDPDRLVGIFVDRARSGGATWSQIGDALGVSKQAAQQRTVPAAYDRYTKRATQVVERAQALAREHGQAVLSPSLLLVASCRDADSRAARLLDACGVTPGDLERALLAALPPAADSVPDRPGFSVAAKQLLDRAAHEAQKLGHSHVGTEHLLLATLRQVEGLPAAVVGRFALSYQAAVAQLSRG